MLGLMVGTTAASILLNTRVNNNIHIKLAENGYKVTRNNLCKYKSEVKDLSVMHLIPVVNLLYTFFHGGKKYKRLADTSGDNEPYNSELLTRLRERDAVQELNQDEKNYIKYREKTHRSVSFGVKWMRLRELFGLDTVSERTKAKIARAGVTSAAAPVRAAAPAATPARTGARTATPTRSVSDIDAEIARLNRERARLLREEALRRVDADTESMLDGIDPTLGRTPARRPAPRTTTRTR